MTSLSGPPDHAITGRTLPQCLRTNGGSHNYLVRGPVLRQSKLVPDKVLLAGLCPGPTVAATSGLGELANIDLQVVRVQAVLFNNRTTGKLQVQFVNNHLVALAYLKTSRLVFVIMKLKETQNHL